MLSNHASIAAQFGKSPWLGLGGVPVFASLSSWVAMASELREGHCHSGRNRSPPCATCACTPRCRSRTRS